MGRFVPAHHTDTGELGRVFINAQIGGLLPVAMVGQRIREPFPGWLGSDADQRALDDRGPSHPHSSPGDENQRGVFDVQGLRR